MEVTQNGMNGVCAARHVEEEIKPATGLAQIQCHPKTAKIVTIWDHPLLHVRAITNHVEVVYTTFSLGGHLTY